MRQPADMPPYVLGLDLGSASLGWALIALASQHNPAGLIRAGVRIFQPGVEGSALDIERGKDQSRAVMRREARLHRRQLRRHAARQRDLFKLLQQHGFLPGGPDADNSASSEQRHPILNALDKELTKCLLANAANDPVAATRISQSLPYQLRKAALDRKLEPQELGRVLYHLIQRRGFKSNRREGKKGKQKEEELGKVKAGISELEQKMVSSGARTLGEYFAGLDPHQQKVRRIWTARRMFEDEFEKIWTAQQAYAPDILTPELKAEIAHLLFFQRPIASQEHLIGRCELEPEERRAPWATLEAQQFRVLQKVNDLKVVVPGSLDDQPLTPEDREKVYLALQSEGDKTFAALRKLLRLSHSQFNLERGGEKTLRGNRSNVLMRSVFAMRWDQFSPDQRHKAVEHWRTTEDRDTLVKIGMESWGLDELAATRWADKYPEDGYCSLSLKAIGKLLRRMEAGMPFKTAEKEVYGERFSGQEPKGFLPTVHEALPTLRNPAVERAVTEMRKVVNAIVREYGRPYEIRLEMARELRKPRKEREAITKTNRNRQREKEQTKARILRECGIQNPSRDDIEKAILFEECGGICPYTGRTLEFSALFADSQFDVEHIIPLSRYPDDSFLNKTLCYHEENRNVKRGRTPWGAYGADEERWAAILERVGKFNNPAKLTRFQLRTQEELEEFTQRQMNDTRYTTRLAADLLGTLYGGRDETLADGSKRRAIFATSGQVTATLRRVWKLESILREALGSSNGENKGKPRTDHRHHAIDAIVVALTDERTVKLLSTAAAQAPEWPLDRRVFRRIESPWANFVDSIRPHIEQMIVSHRPEHKMSGALHDETNYGRPYLDGKKTYVHIRKPITSLSAKELSSIVDPVVMAAVQQKAEGLGGDLSKCESAGDWPLMPAKDGSSLPIRRVRIRKVLEVTPIAEGIRQRFVAESSNHHVEIFAQLDTMGREKNWDSIIVSLLEASERDRKKEKVVQRSYPGSEHHEFKFSLMGGDTVELHRDCEHSAARCSPTLYRVRTIAANGQLSLVKVTDARLKQDVIKAREWWSPGCEALRRLGCRKVVVDLLGRVHPAND